MPIHKFTPKNRCTIIKNAGTDLYGMSRPGIRKLEKCSIVRLLVTNEKSSVRADSSASRGNAMELEADGVFLLVTTTSAGIDDLIEVGEQTMRVMAIHPRFNAAGQPHHMEVHCTYWNEKNNEPETFD